MKPPCQACGGSGKNAIRLPGGGILLRDCRTCWGLGACIYLHRRRWRLWPEAPPTPARPGLRGPAIATGVGAALQVLALLATLTVAPAGLREEGIEQWSVGIPLLVGGLLMLFVGGRLWIFRATGEVSRRRFRRRIRRTP